MKSTGSNVGRTRLSRTSNALSGSTPNLRKHAWEWPKTLLELGRTADAVSHLQKAERLDPENKIPHYLLASAYRSLGDSAGAAKEFAVYKRLGASHRSRPTEHIISDRSRGRVVHIHLNEEMSCPTRIFF